MGIWILLFIAGGLLFVYFNITLFCKFNLAASFIKIYVNIKLFKKEHVIDKKIYYTNILKKAIGGRKEKQKKSKVAKSPYSYFKYVKKIMRFFIVKNIHFYPECIDNFSSFAVEFMIVNNILKRPFIKG
jgi:hypothetical protein